MSEWAFKGGFCAYVISTKIVCAGPFHIILGMNLYETTRIQEPSFQSSDFRLWPGYQYRILSKLNLRNVSALAVNC